MRILVYLLLGLALFPAAVEAKIRVKDGRCYNFRTHKQATTGSCDATATVMNRVFRCSRSKAHKGKHHAHGVDKTCFLKWKG